MACVGRTKTCNIVPPNHFGAIPGVEVGTTWLFRVQVGLRKIVLLKAYKIVFKLLLLRYLKVVFTVHQLEEYMAVIIKVHLVLY